MKPKTNLCVNIGCGTDPSDGWLNMDNSPAIKLANSPFKYNLAKYLRLLNASQIENIEWNCANSIQFADATKTLPLDDSTVECIYTSHMFEHLSQDGAKSFLKEAIRVLKVGGILRIAVPDLSLAVNKYLASEDADAFMRNILVSAPPINTLREKLMLFLTGYRHHQWMYDGNSLSKIMSQNGFKEVEVCTDGYTKIANPAGLNLYEQVEITVYIEGVKQ
tara:strand:+ start:2134 stop:2793 length:660 start_codon:yes stop_codon:yes gene_type:complete